ncbi:hypothetical protein J9317_02310 [Metabacillus sp. KIGAM252]|uniref:Uncharacterized protein n=1 Tax=Metabacillus flavus TaxID=2823519 RepID=A0ABS5LAE1_9BACI|nr:hypothetical protein [Metabacillus flavus]MBS2967604.1 hypothetical protein [Metabacillus flavus]
MWKKLFRSSKDEEDDRASLFAELQQDEMFQEMVRKAEERLEFLLELDKLCDKCIYLLESPFERLDMVDLIVNEIEELKPKIQVFQKSADSKFDHKEIKNTVTPYLKLSELMIGNHKDSKGIISLINSGEDSQSKKMQKSLEKSIYSILKIKNQISKMFDMR